MSKHNPPSLSPLTLFGTILLTAVALGWSVGLIGKGIWDLGWTSASKSNQTLSNIPDSFARVPNVATGVFSYGGSTAWAPLRLLVDSAIQAERPELQLRYIQPKTEPPSSRIGIQMLLKGQLTFVQSSHPLLEEQYRQARQLGIRLKQIPIAVSGIVVAVHPSLDIPGLTIDQLRLIYSGQITNWHEVGGSKIEIKPYSRPISTGGTVEFLQTNVLKGQKLGANVEYVDTTTEALRRLAEDVRGIYYGSAPAILPQCAIKPLPLGQQSGQFIAPYYQPLVSPAQCPERRNRLNTKAFQTATYPLTHYLYVVIKENGGIEEQVGRVYANFLLTPEGQRLIAKAGFIPLR
ncbi:MAG: substrate-binding domain-containing protein [Xenococcaceae cyanobacterium MO_188.B32]|nr:substrate-binding domain-containing protein [Xenococcaceae cyanobacterium MO_188.B32]